MRWRPDDDNHPAPNHVRLRRRDSRCRERRPWRERLRHEDKITLSQNYNRSLPAGYEAGYPDPNPGAPPKTSFTANPQVIPSGTMFTTWACEANALIALGAASGA